MQCREGCGACCIAPSISSPMPGLPGGKAAGVPCPHLDEHLKCGLWEKPERPQVCIQFKAEPNICGSTREHAVQTLTLLEQTT